MRNRFEWHRPAAFAALFLLATALTAAGCAGDGGVSFGGGGTINAYRFEEFRLQSVTTMTAGGVTTCTNEGVPPTDALLLEAGSDPDLTLSHNDIKRGPLALIPADPAFVDPRLTFVRTFTRREATVLSVQGSGILGGVTTRTDSFPASLPLTGAALLGGIVPYNVTNETLNRITVGVGSVAFDYGIQINSVGPGDSWRSSPEVIDNQSGAIVPVAFEAGTVCDDATGRITGSAGGAALNPGGLAAFRYVPPATADVSFNADGLAFDTVVVASSGDSVTIGGVSLFAVGGLLLQVGADLPDAARGAAYSFD
ncbi:MAG: hypothetical protein K8I02_03555, partial [Candidatus Methylomirabilis sp.]|nr:hypothetical protein [Deltaproteobacteria bacterium]